MMGVQIALERGFHVLIATGEDMDEPRGLISFSNTPLGEEFRSTVLKEKIMISLILTFTVLLALYWFIDLVFILLIILLSDFLVFRNFKSATCSQFESSIYGVRTSWKVRSNGEFF